jgi:hypothetical protein
LAIIRASPEQATATLASGTSVFTKPPIFTFVQVCSSDGPQSDDLLRPVFMGCATKNAKVVAMSLGSLQRLISLKAVPRSAVPRLVATMNDAMSQGVDIQLRILQTLVSLVPNFPDVHGSLLGEVRSLPCFEFDGSTHLLKYKGPFAMLQTSRIANCSGIVNRCGYPSAARHVRGG